MKKKFEELAGEVSISKRRVQDYLENEQRKYGYAMQWMYDMGYQDNLSIFDMELFRSMLLEQHGDEIKCFYDYPAAKLSLSSDIVLEYGKTKTEDEELKEVIEKYQLIKGYKETVENYNKLYLKLTIPKLKDKINVKVKYKEVGNTLGYEVTGNVGIEDRSIYETLSRGNEEGIKRRSYETIYQKAIYNQMSKGPEGKGLLLEGLSKEEESNYIYGILEGKLEVTGEKKEEFEKLKNTLEENTKYKKEIRKEVRSLIRRTEVGKIRVCYYTEKYMFYTTVEQNISQYVQEDNSIYIGSTVLDRSNLRQLSATNRLLGFTGEYFSEDFVEEKAYVKEAYPTELLGSVAVDNKKYKILPKRYYSVDRLSYKEEGQVPSVIGDLFVPKLKTEEELYEKYKVSDEQGLYRKLRKYVSSLGEIETDKTLTTELLLGLLLSDTGKQKYTFKTNRKKTEDTEYLKSALVAGSIYRVL